MNDEAQTAWTAPQADIAVSDRMLSLERQLHLVDRILGLEAQVAQLSSSTSLTPSEELGTELQLQRMRTSPAWRIGRVATSPMRIARRILRRGTHA